jgi:hypothetical protein
MPLGLLLLDLLLDRLLPGVCRRTLMCLVRLHPFLLFQLRPFLLLRALPGVLPGALLDLLLGPLPDRQLRGLPGQLVLDLWELLREAALVLACRELAVGLHDSGRGLHDPAFLQIPPVGSALAAGTPDFL